MPGDPDAPATVVITAGATTSTRSLSSFIGAGGGVFGSALEVDQHIRRERDDELIVGADIRGPARAGAAEFYWFV